MPRSRAISGLHQPVARQEGAARGGGDDGFRRLFHHGARLHRQEAPDFGYAVCRRRRRRNPPLHA
jgi:hypothetical protein